MDLLKKEVETWLKEYFESKGTYEKKLYEAMAYSINIGGKRIRPLLMLLTYELYQKDHKEVLPFAGALEMIHTYSLIHDDLPCMDNDDLRRGKPTSHKVFGEAMAILAGDGLLNEAMVILFSQGLSGELRKIQAGYSLAKAAGVEGMIAGQVVDMLGEGRSIPEEELLFMHKNKTGALIKVAIQVGAILGGASQKEISILEQYGEKLGLAFQVKDDILDVIGDTALLGKKVRSDEENDKTTFITMYGLERCKALCEELTEECLALLKSLHKNTEPLEQITMFLLKREY